MALTEETSQALRLFVEHANWVQLHPLDWKRFYDVIHGSHQRGEEIEQPTEIRHALTDSGAPDVDEGGVRQTLDQLSFLYLRGRELLAHIADD